MGQRGQDIAIGLLRLLISAERPIAVAEALARLGAPRATLHRVARIFAARGIVDCRRRGWLAFGPVGLALAARREALLQAEDQRRLAPRPRPIPGASGAGCALSRCAAATQWSEAPLGRRPRFRIGFSNADMNNLWRVALVHSVEYGAVKYRSLVRSLAVKHAEGCAERQAGDIGDLLGKGVDGLIVSAHRAPALAAAFAEAARRGVPVVMVDRGDEAAPHASFVTCDDEVIGRVTAIWLAEKLDGRGDVLLLPGLQAAAPARARLSAALQALRDFPQIRILDICWSDWRQDLGRAIVEAVLARGAKIDGVWCDSGLQAVGSLKAFIAAERRIPPHTGGDLNLAYKLAIRHGAPLAAVDYPPAMGLKAVETLLDFLRGRSVAKRVDVPTEIVVTRGHATTSVRPDLWADQHVRWDLPDDLILASGLGPSYDPRRFRVNYVGTRYNRSAAHPSERADGR